LERTKAVMQSSCLTVNGCDTWNGDAALRRAYIDTAARRVQVAANLLAGHCRSVGSLLEIGLSPGVGLAPIVATRPEVAYCGALDALPSARMQAGAPQKVPASYIVGGSPVPVDFYWCNAEVDAFPFADNTFDLAICSDVLEHLLLDPYHLVEEVNRVVKPGGYFLLATSPSQGYWVHKLKLIMGRSIEEPYSGYGPYGRHNRLFLPREVRALVEAGGFSVVHAQTFALYPGHAGGLARAVLNIIGRVRAIADYVGSHIFVLGRETGAPAGRPTWLYEQWDKRSA
jgi:SAM-dependent methyltransferase